MTEVVQFREDGTFVAFRAASSGDAITGQFMHQSKGGDIAAYGPGQSIGLRVFQSSGGPLDVQIAALWLFRVAPLTPTLPT